MELHFSWFAVANFIAGAVNVALLVYVRRYWDKPGGKWFFALIASQGALCFIYGIELLTASPIELLYWLSISGWIVGVCNATIWLAFCLRYTGRGSLLRGPAGLLLFGTAALVSLLIATDFVHGDLYKTFSVTVELGAPVFSFEGGQVVQLTNVLIFTYTLTAIAVLLETFLRSWPLYRTQTAALVSAPLIASAVDPVVAATGLVALENATLITMTYGFTAVLFTYALFGGSMLELDPVTRRLGKKAALDDLAIPVVTVDDQGRLISINDKATVLLGTSEQAAFGDPISGFLDNPPSVNPDTETIEVTIEGRRREYRVVAESFEDADGTLLGYTLSFQDITDITRRERRLTILNRVLRHNLRNDLNVVAGHADIIATEVSGDLADYAETIIETSDELTAVGEKARELDRIVDKTTPHEQVPVADLVESVLDKFRQRYPHATVTADIPEDLTLWTDSNTLGVVFENLVENALEHNDDDQPTVSIRGRAVSNGQTDGGVSLGSGTAESSQTLSAADTANLTLFEVTDNGPGIPDAEVEVIRGKKETPLKHGSGLGLWVVQAGVTALGGRLSFEGDGHGTTVSVWIPGQVDPEDRAE